MPGTHKPIHLSEEEQTRFWRFVAIRPGCWEWQGARSSCGYGTWRGGKHKKMAHRVAYAVANNEDPGDKDILHECDNPACCNPLHMSLGTQADNNRDMFRKGRARPGWAIGATRGERHPQAKLTVECVREIRALGADGTPHRRIAQSFGICQTTASRIIRGAIWGSVS